METDTEVAAGFADQEKGRQLFQSGLLRHLVHQGPGTDSCAQEHAQTCQQRGGDLITHADLEGNSQQMRMKRKPGTDGQAGCRICRARRRGASCSRAAC